MNEPKTIVTAKIVYINRPHRYFTARFVLNGHVFYESFKYVEAGDLIGRS